MVLEPEELVGIQVFYWNLFLNRLSTSRINPGVANIFIGKIKDSVL